MSQVWQGICSIWHLVQRGLGWNLGNGKQVSFWHDNWLKSGTVLKSVIDPHVNEEVQDIMVCSMSRDGVWATDKFQHLLPSLVVKEILAMIPPKESRGRIRYKSFLWKILKGGLLTNSIRFDRHLATNATCPVCQARSESIIHVLRDCKPARDLWNALGIDQIDSNFFNYNLLDWVHRNIANTSASFRSIPWPTVFTTGLSSLWHCRNNFVF
ncbi:Reverse transcriptase zinc-binding domain [Sesbania bispinosa]|nr:Reverse transcriptase zinc-binding domain [Sesbania bispinosa]